MTEQKFSGRTLRILLVDNSRTTRAAMQWALENEGFEVSTATTAQEAIDLIQTGAFHLAIFDLYMPQMNGSEATQIIRALPDVKHAQLPIIALTGSTDENDRKMALDAGMSEYVVKSNDHVELFKILHRYRSEAGNLPV